MLRALSSTTKHTFSGAAHSEIPYVALPRLLVVEVPPLVFSLSFLLIS